MENKIPKLVNVASATSPYSIQLTSDVQTYVFYGNKTLSAGFTIQEVGTPTEGMGALLVFTGNIVTGAYVFNILGTSMNVVNSTANITANPFIAICIYGNAGWHVTRLPLAPIIASAIFGTDADGNLTIANTAITAAMLAGSIPYSKLLLTSGIVNTDIAAAAAIDYSKLADLTASEIVITGAGKKLESAPVATYPSLLELSRIKGLSANAQTQISAVVSDLASNYTDNTALASLISAYYTSTQTDAAIVSALSGLTTIWNGTTLTTSTDLNLLSSWKQEYLLNPTSGAITLDLPQLSKYTTGEWLKFTLVAVSTPSTINGNGSEKMTDFTGTAQATITLSAVGDYVKIAKNAGVWYVVETNI